MALLNGPNTYNITRCFLTMGGVTWSIAHWFQRIQPNILSSYFFWTNEVLDFLMVVLIGRAEFLALI